jgi:hypothetical protein
MITHKNMKVIILVIKVNGKEAVMTYFKALPPKGT